EASGLILDPVVAGALTPSDERVERGEEVEGHQHGPGLEELAVVDGAACGQAILQLPGETDARVVVGAPGPPRVASPDDGLPQAGEPLGEAIEGGADADLLDEGERVPPPTNATGRHPTERHVSRALEILASGHPGRGTRRSHARAGVRRRRAPARRRGTPRSRRSWRCHGAWRPRRSD